MKRFKIIGSFDKEQRAFEEGDNLAIQVPLITENNHLLYGIDTIVRKMEKQKIYPSELGFDFMILGSLVYLADTRISREEHAQDSWTREISLEIPVSDVKRWNETKWLLQRMLAFLTGDIWDISFRERAINFENLEKVSSRTVDFSVVSLFSGGMDSLISTINFLEAGENVLLVSHAGEGITKNAQTNILSRFDEFYPDNLHFRVDLWLSFNKGFLLEGGEENSTRGRSFLFIATSIFAMTGTANLRTLQIPENGLIALNVPLDSLRIGSHSTRTTHPFYLSLWNDLLEMVGTNIDVRNPYWNKTKGEMAAECLNKDVLYELMGISVSCSSMIKATWQRNSPQHCGFCVPCLIRRAAMQKAFGVGEDSTVYTEMSVKEAIKRHSEGIGIQLRSFQYSIQKLKQNKNLARLYIHKPGPLPKNEQYLSNLANVYYRGMMEIDDFIEAHKDDEV